MIVCVCAERYGCIYMICVCAFRVKTVCVWGEAEVCRVIFKAETIPSPVLAGDAAVGG